MNPMLAIQLLGTGLSVYSSIKEGQAIQDQAAYDNYQLSLQKKQDEIVGRQKMNQRNYEFSYNESVNRATFFSGMNRDVSDRSVKAFLDKQKKLAQEDVNAIASQTTVAGRQVSMQMSANKLRAAQAKQSAIIGATSAVASGLYRYEQYRTDNLFEA